MESNIENFDNGNAVSELDGNVISKTFFWMFLGLLGTALVAWYTYASDLWVKLVISENAFLILALVELAVVIIFSALFKKCPPVIVAGLYFIYSMVNGVTFSTIFVVYDMTSIIYAFAATAALFGVLGLVGAKTKADLTKFGTICSVGLLVGLVFSIINIFLGNTMVDIILTWALLIVFCGLTIYDINKLKKAHEMGEYESNKLHIYFAMELYLDFINIFIRLLSIMGSRSND